MGWWSETIMGGDGPLDLEIMFNDYISKKESSELFAKYLSFMLEDLKNGKFKDYNNHIAQQVLGYMVMTQGIELNDVTKEILELCKEGAETELKYGCDGWSNPEARMKNLFALINACNNYDGNSVEFEEEGLLDSMMGDAE